MSNALPRLAEAARKLGHSKVSVTDVTEVCAGKDGLAGRLANGASNAPGKSISVSCFSLRHITGGDGYQSVERLDILAAIPDPLGPEPPEKPLSTTAAFVRSCAESFPEPVMLLSDAELKDIGIPVRTAAAVETVEDKPKRKKAQSRPE